MNSLTPLAKTLAGLGILLLFLGGLFYLADKIPGLGKLPGDIYIQRKNFTLYFPLATSLIVSFVLSLILYFFIRIKG